MKVTKDFAIKVALSTGAPVGPRSPTIRLAFDQPKAKRYCLFSGKNKQRALEFAQRGLRMARAGFEKLCASSVTSATLETIREVES